MAIVRASAAERERIRREFERLAQDVEREADRLVAQLAQRLSRLSPEEIERVLDEEAVRIADRLAEQTRSAFLEAARAGAASVAGPLAAGAVVTTAADRAWRQSVTRGVLRNSQGQVVQLRTLVRDRTGETLERLRGSLQRSAREGKSALDAARRLRDSARVGMKAEMTAALAEVEAAARAAIVASGDPVALARFRRTADQFRRYGHRLGQTAAEGGRLPFSMRTWTVRTANAVERAVRANNASAVDAAINNWTRRKAAYQQRVIARTEIARAYTQAHIDSAAGAPWVVGFQWNVESGADREEDICDLYASQNLYGLGKGVYPFGKQPELPAHPNCMCFLTDVIDSAVGLDDARPAAPPMRLGATESAFGALSPGAQRSILGSTGLEAFSAGRVPLASVLRR